MCLSELKQHAEVIFKAAGHTFSISLDVRPELQPQWPRDHQRTVSAISTSLCVWVSDELPHHLASRFITTHTHTQFPCVTGWSFLRPEKFSVLTATPHRRHLCFNGVGGAVVCGKVHKYVCKREVWGLIISANDVMLLLLNLEFTLPWRKVLLLESPAGGTAFTLHSLNEPHQNSNCGAGPRLKGTQTEWKDGEKNSDLNTRNRGSKSFYTNSWVRQQSAAYVSTSELSDMLSS